MATSTASAPTHRIKTRLPEEFQRDSNPSQPLTTFLGLFSIGLGLAELLTPRNMANLTGVPHPSLLQAYGVREITSGLGILANRRPSSWLWARVAGDVMDLATLGAAFGEASGDQRQRVLASIGAVAGVTLLDVLCAKQHGGI